MTTKVKKLVNNRNILIMSILVSIVIMICVFPFLSQAFAKDKFERNSFGLTFGGMEQGFEEDYSKNPDLIAAQATNGELGYIYYKELYKTMEFDGASAEDLIARQEAYSDKMSEAFAKAANEYYNYELINEEDAKLILEMLTITPDVGEIVGEFTDKLSETAERGVDVNGKNISKTKAQNAIQNVSTTNFYEIYDRALEEVGVKLPVYKEDGKTQVGWFIVDTY